MGAVPVEDRVGQERGVDRRIEDQVGIADEVAQLLHGVGSQFGDRPRAVDFRRHVGDEPLVPRHHHLRRPAPRSDAQKLELDGQQAGLPLGPGDIGVDAVHERRDDGVAPVVVVAHLGRHVAPEPEQPRADVALQFARTEDLRHRAGRLPPPQLELEQPVARRRVALREEEVVLVLRVDVGDAPPVGHDLDRRLQAGSPERLGRGVLRRRRSAETVSAAGQQQGADHRRADCEPRHQRPCHNALLPAAAEFPAL